MVRQAINILRLALLDFWDNLLVLTTANLIWAFSLVPAVGVAALLGNLLGLIAGALVAAIFVGPASLALYSLTTEVNRRERLELGDYFRAIKRLYRRGWLLGLLNALFIILAIVNIIFYSSSTFQNNPLTILIFLWVYLVFSWFVAQLYLWPLAVRMEPFTLRGLLRNTFLSTFKYPVISLLVGGLMTALLFASYLLGFLPVILFGMVFHALVSNQALTAVVERENQRAEALKEQGLGASNYQVEVPLLPVAEPEPDPLYTTRNAPPGVKRRGNG